MYSLGLDIGSSSVKVALADLTYKSKPMLVKVPEHEMAISSPFPGWAEQDADLWWQCCLDGIQKILKKSGITPDQIKSIGISYQMHGLVLTDVGGNVVRPAIIWCDSRAIESGLQLAEGIEPDVIRNSLYNLPGNFTASKLKWVIDHEPRIFERVHKVMLPGDYIAFKMSGVYSTTFTAMSEGVLFDFTRHTISAEMLNALGVNNDLFPSPGGSFEILAKTHADFETLTGIKAGTPISYRAGDQPNNAFALGVLHEGEAAGTGGTSGVVYTVSRDVSFDDQSRVNTFAHVNHQKHQPSLGTLLCINGTGILYHWLKTHFFGNSTYEELEIMASKRSSDGVMFYPFGNGAERMLGNTVVNAGIQGLDFNRHDTLNILRAGLEGIACAFAMGMEILEEVGARPSSLRVGNDNLFLSHIFAQTLADIAGVEIQMFETTGAIGAAMGSALGAGLTDGPDILRNKLSLVNHIEPSQSAYATDLYQNWKKGLIRKL